MNFVCTYFGYLLLLLNKLPQNSMAENTTILFSLTIMGLIDSAGQFFYHQGLFIWKLNRAGMYNVGHSQGAGYSQVINQCLSSDFHMGWTSNSIAPEFIDSERESCQSSCLGLRSPRTSFLLQFIGQSQSKCQPTLKRMENKLYLLIAKQHAHIRRKKNAKI